MSGRAFDARERVIRAVLRVLQSDHEERPHAHSADEAEYASEQLALAARELTEAVEALPPEQQPVGWDRTGDLCGMPWPHEPHDYRHALPGFSYDVTSRCPGKPAE